jgi:hypothetical protein
MSETDLMRRLMVRASQLGARLFRQNVGLAWVGKVTRGPGSYKLGPSDVLIRNARPFHAGHEGMADLGGWVPVKITPEMVGTTIAVYTQVEVKENSRPTAPQLAWIKAVNAAGGKAGIAHNDDELSKILFSE